MGIIGTVLGLVHVLQNLAAPSTLGPSISAAFIATLMGVGAANVIFLPIANRLKAISAEEVELRMMTVEGILSIQAGDNPRLVSEKLMSYLPPAERALERGRAAVRAPRRRVQGGLIMARGRRRGAAHGGARQRTSDERWLLTYADMITLLMALFMVLFSISSVNISKYQALQQSLKAAFSGNILPGGKSIAQQGSTANASHAPAHARTAGDGAADGDRQRSGNAARHAARSAQSAASQAAAQQAAAQREASVFAHIKHELDALRRSHTASQERADVDRTARPGDQGAHRRPAVRLRPGDARAAAPTRCWARSAQLLNIDETHPIDVEGNTDNVPIHSGAVPQQLGALDGARQHRRALPDRQQASARTG